MIIPDELNEKSNEELLLLYRQTEDPQIKQEIVLRYVYLVKNIATKFKGVYASFAQIDDIVNEGIIALMAAVDKFDPDKNVKFETFVSKRLKGLIIDIARKQDWIPRNVRRDSKEINEAMGVLFEKFNRHPTSQEMADYLNISLERYLKILGKSNLCNVISLDYYIWEQSGEQNTDTLASREMLPEETLEEKEFHSVLKEGLLSLREKEQMVISLYYRKELTMKEIAAVMKLSEPRISQIHANALAKLKVYMEKKYK